MCSHRPCSNESSTLRIGYVTIPVSHWSRQFTAPLSVRYWNELPTTYLQTLLRQHASTSTISTASTHLWLQSSTSICATKPDYLNGFWACFPHLLQNGHPKFYCMYRNFHQNPTHTRSHNSTLILKCHLFPTPSTLLQDISSWSQMLHDSSLE